MAATNPQTLITEGGCFSCFGIAPLGELMVIALLDRIASAIAPSEDNFRLSDAGDTRISAVGDFRVWT
jgi:hypothetical protein